MISSSSARPIRSPRSIKTYDRETRQFSREPRAVQQAGAYGGEAKSYFIGEDKIIIAKQRSGPAGTYIRVRFDGPRGRWEER